MRAILLAGGISLLISLIGTRYAIRQFTKMGYGQEVRDDGPTTHHVKRGTPTMGGVVLIGASVIGYFAAKIITVSTPSASAPSWSCAWRVPRPPPPRALGMVMPMKPALTRARTLFHG